MSLEDARSRLIEAGLEGLLAAGFNSTGVADIVAAAGVPKGSFYYYFDSKEAFACAVVDRWAARNTARRQALFVANRSMPPLRRLRAYLETYATALGERGHVGGCLLGNLSAEIADHSETVRGRLRAAFAEWQTMLHDLLVEAQARGDLRAGLEPEALAAYLVDGWEGALLRMKAEKSDRPLRLFITITFDHLLSGDP